MAEQVAADARRDPDTMFVAGNVQTPLSVEIAGSKCTGPITRTTAAEELVSARRGIDDDGTAWRCNVAVVRARRALLARRVGRPGILRRREAGRGQQGGQGDDDGLGNHFVGSVVRCSYESVL